MSCPTASPKKAKLIVVAAVASPTPNVPATCGRSGRLTSVESGASPTNKAASGTMRGPMTTREVSLMQT